MAKMRDFLHYYQTHKKSIFNYILYRVSFDRDIAEDLTSEIFLKAYEHFESFDEKKPFKPWIFTIARNHLMNFFAQKKTISIEEIKELSQETKIIENLENKLLTGKVLRLIKTLPEAQQEVLMLRFKHDLSHAEIAELLGKEEGAVRTMVSRALDTLRNKFYINYSPENI